MVVAVRTPFFLLKPEGLMPTSPTDICNMALDLLKERAMGDYNAPDNALEEMVARNYPLAKEYVLKKHRWMVARQTVTGLAALSVTDAEYPTVIQLPADCLAVWTVNGFEDGWHRRAGQGAGRLAGNFTAPASLVYTRNISEGEIPVELALAIGGQLAHLCKSGPTLDLSRGERADIAAEAIDRIDAAVDILGTEGGVSEVSESRFVETLRGRRFYDPKLRKFAQ
jgi:hypothetical protein